MSETRGFCGWNRALGLLAIITLWGAAAGMSTAATSQTAIQRAEPGEGAKSVTGWHEDEPTTEVVSRLLPKSPAKGPEGFFTEITPELEPAVRRILAEDYAAADAILVPMLETAKTDAERARAYMWLGLAAGQRAIDTPAEGNDSGSSATMYLYKAIRLDPRVTDAPDVVRTLAELAAFNFGMRDFPEAPTVLEEAMEKADRTKKALDYFYAGVMARRTAKIAWLYGDTSQHDRLAYRMLKEAVKLEPGRYEFWTQYLPSMAPVYLHTHMTSESVAMYEHFQSLRHPLFVDQGPTKLHITTREGFSVAQEDQLFEDLLRKNPDDPFPPYQLALWAIETTPTLAVERFHKFVDDLDAGKIRLLPREEGYRPSAWYKLAFLYEEQKGTTQALALYEKVKAYSPNYAVTNGNMAHLYARMAEAETTGPEKLRLTEKAIELAQQQMKSDYQGKGAAPSRNLRRQLLRSLPALKREVGRMK